MPRPDPKNGAQDLELIKRISNRGRPVVLIGHDMPGCFHVHRLGKRAGVVSPAEVSVSDVVSFITGAEEIPGSGSIDAAS